MAFRLRLEVPSLLPESVLHFLDLFVRFCTSVYVISDGSEFIILFALRSLSFYLCFTGSDCKIDGKLANYVCVGDAVKA